MWVMEYYFYIYILIFLYIFIYIGIIECQFMELDFILSDSRLANYFSLLLTIFILFYFG